MQERKSSVVKNVAAFGEIVWDVFSDGVESLGGAPLNFAYYCAKLGANSCAISAVGYDERGRKALGIISKNGVDSSTVAVLKNSPTGIVRVGKCADGLPDFEICAPAAWDFIGSSCAERAKRWDMFYFGTLSQRGGANAGALEAYLDSLNPDALVVCDVNFRQNFYTRKIVEESFKRADIVKFNESEFPLIADMLGLSVSDKGAACREIVERFGLRFAVLTLGSEGYLVADSAGIAARGKALKISQVDTVGAGDSFFAAFTFGILSGLDVSEAAENANALAAKVCCCRGAMCL